jgi:hypothetical protein
MRKCIKPELKRKKITFTINPKLYEILEKYCKENNIENYSNYIEKVIIEKLNKK